MMAFIDELKDRANDVAQVASRKVGEAVGITKVKMALAEKQSTLRALYKELGEMVYVNFKRDIEDNEALEDKFAEIDLVIDSIDELKNELKQIKNMKTCPHCGSDIEEDANYCSKCGMEA